jgi:small basic protein (TIGR04137 family)
MSVDKSLKVASALARPRSVLSRTERLAQLRDEGRWTEEKSVYGIPKVRVRRVKRKAKAAKAEAPADAAAAGAEAPKVEGSAPAKK